MMKVWGRNTSINHWWCRHAPSYWRKSQYQKSTLVALFEPSQITIVRHLREPVFSSRQSRLVSHDLKIQHAQKCIDLRRRLQAISRDKEILCCVAAGEEKWIFPKGPRHLHIMAAATAGAVPLPCSTNRHKNWNYFSSNHKVTCCVCSLRQPVRFPANHYNSLQAGLTFDLPS